MRRVVETGSQPYDDGSGYRYDIEVCGGKDGADYLWLGHDKALHIEVNEWEQLKADVDAAISAFSSLPTPTPAGAEPASRRGK